MAMVTKSSALPDTLPGIMRILLLTWHFPPVNTIAAVRLGKMARFFHQRDHRLRVLTAARTDGNISLKLELPADLVESTRWIDIDKIVHPLSHLQAHLQDRAATRSRDRRPAGAQAAPIPSAAGAAQGASPRAEPSLKQRISEVYNDLFFFPDRYIGWVPPVVRAGRRLIQAWRPDLIYASGPPFSVCLAADLLARRTGTPWVAELRDRWVDDPYFGRPAWRYAVESRLERRILGGAAAIVTVSEPWADFYRMRYGKPTATIFNGYDPTDFARLAAPVPAADGCLRILHTGTIYAGFRDPTPLFQAIAGAGLGPEEIKVIFYGTEDRFVRPLARAAGVEAVVEVHGAVSYERSLALQQAADVLLLLQWNNPREQGNIPAKVFEYFAARRPILGIGFEDGVPARWIRERAAGLYSSDPAVIADQLRRWIAARRETGALATLPESARAGLARDAQYAKLESFLGELVAPHD